MRIEFKSFLGMSGFGLLPTKPRETFENVFLSPVIVYACYLSYQTATT